MYVFHAVQAFTKLLGLKLVNPADVDPASLFTATFPEYTPPLSTIHVGSNGTGGGGGGEEAQGQGAARLWLTQWFGSVSRLPFKGLAFHRHAPRVHAAPGSTLREENGGRGKEGEQGARGAAKARLGFTP